MALLTDLKLRLNQNSPKNKDICFIDRAWYIRKQLSALEFIFV